MINDRWLLWLVLLLIKSYLQRNYWWVHWRILMSSWTPHTPLPVITPRFNFYFWIHTFIIDYDDSSRWQQTAPQTPAAGAARFSLSTHSPVQAAATLALNVLGIKAPVKSKTPRAKQPQLGAVAVAEGSVHKDKTVWGAGRTRSRPRIRPRRARLCRRFTGKKGRYLRQARRDSHNISLCRRFHENKYHHRLGPLQQAPNRLKSLIFL